MFTRGMLATLALVALLRGQEKPIGISGTFTTGYYSATTHGEANQSLSFVPVGAKFDMTGYYISPDFLAISMQPELNIGPQAGEANFQGGNGIALQLTFLRKRIPFTFHYANVQVQEVYFGSLTQVSGYSLKNRTRDLGLNLELNKSSRFPATSIDWGIGSVDSKSDILLVSDYLSHGSHFNVDSRYQWGAWTMLGFLHHQEQQSDLLEPLDGGTHLGSLLQSVTQLEGTASRDFFQDSELNVDIGRQSTSSQLSALPLNLTTNYARANLRMLEKRKWKGSLRAGYTSNLASQLLAQTNGSLNAPGSVEPSTATLLPFGHSLSNFNLAGLTSASLSRGFGIYGSAERNSTLSSDPAVLVNATYFNTAGGITYGHSLGWVILSGEYGRDFGLGSVTGQSGTIVGQTYRFSAQHPGSSGLTFDGSVHGMDQTVRSEQPLKNHNFSAELGASDRIAGNVRARLAGGWQWASVESEASQYRTNGYTARAGLDHPRLQISASLNNTLGSSLPFFGQGSNELEIGSVILAPRQIVPSDYRTISANLHLTPIRKLEIAVLWTHSRQNLAGVVNNDYELLDGFVRYHFRKIQVEAGSIRSNQTFASYPTTLRDRFYVRLVRTARIL